MLKYEILGIDEKKGEYDYKKIDLTSFDKIDKESFMGLWVFINLVVGKRKHQLSVFLERDNLDRIEKFLNSLVEMYSYEILSLYLGMVREIGSESIVDYLEKMRPEKAFDLGYDLAISRYNEGKSLYAINGELKIYERNIKEDYNFYKDCARVVYEKIKELYY